MRLPPDMVADMQATGCAIRRADGPAPRLFQVRGERASGTNFLRWIVGRNTALRHTDTPGWKHGFPGMIALPAELLIIGAVRNAADWALSLYARPWHAHPDLQRLGFSDFIRAEWRAVVDRPSDFDDIPPDLAVKGAELQFDRHPITGARFENLFALRRAKLAALLGLAARGGSVALVRMETAQAAPEETVRLLQSVFDVAPRTGDFTLPPRRLGTRFKPKAPDQRRLRSNHAR